MISLKKNSAKGERTTGAFTKAGQDIVTSTSNS